MIKTHLHKFRKSHFQGFVMPNIALFGSNYPTLVDAATTDGSIGVFVYDTTTNTWVTATNADLVAGKKFIIGQKISDTIVKKTQELCFNELNISKLGYRGYTNQVSHIGNNGSTGSFNITTVVKGQTYGFTVIDTTDYGTSNGEARFTFTYVAKTGDTATTIANALIAQVNDALHPMWSTRQGRVPFVTAAAVGATTGIALTVTENGSTFKIALIGEYAYNESTVTYTTDPILGSGLYEQVYAMERESKITGDGVTTMHAANANERTDVPSVYFANSGLTYTLISLYGKNTRDSLARPHYIQHHSVNVMIAVPTAQDTAFDTVFGL